MTDSFNTTNPSRRAILTGIPAAAIGVGALGAAALCEATVDPIFAAIERHRAAFKTACADPTVDDEIKGHKVTQAQKDAERAAWDANAEAFEALVATVPTSIAGVRAAIEWLVKYDEGCIPGDSGKFLATLLKSPALQAA